ncbi:MAG: hypothetical protein LBT44_08200, partial [Clostridiales bacterium]|nr:hypothetical protein [Clostridiales bacterium]
MGVINSLKNLFSAMRNLFSAIGKICNINFKKILLEKEQEMGKSKNNRKPNAPKLGNSSKSNSKEDSMLILSALENKLKREQMEPKQFVDLLINHLTSGGPCSTLNDDMFFYNVFGLLLNYMNIIDIMEKDIKYYNDKKQKNNCLNAETGSLIDNFIEKSESYIKNGSYCVLECYIAINAGNKPFQAFAHLFRMAYLSRFLVSHL